MRVRGVGEGWWGGGGGGASSYINTRRGKLWKKLGSSQAHVRRVHSARVHTAAARGARGREGGMSRAEDGEVRDTRRTVAVRRS